MIILAVIVLADLFNKAVDIPAWLYILIVIAYFFDWTTNS